MQCLVDTRANVFGLHAARRTFTCLHLQLDGLLHARQLLLLLKQQRVGLVVQYNHLLLIRLLQLLDLGLILLVHVLDGLAV